MNKTLILFELSILITFILFYWSIPPISHIDWNSSSPNIFFRDEPILYSKLSESDKVQFEIRFIKKPEPVKRVYIKFSEGKKFIDMLEIEAKVTNISSDTLSISRLFHVISNVISTISLVDINDPDNNLVKNPIFFSSSNLRKLILPPDTIIVDTFDVFRSDALILQPGNIYSVSAYYIFADYEEALKKEKDDDYWSDRASSNTLQFTHP